MKRAIYTLKLWAPNHWKKKCNLIYFKNYIKGRERTIKDILMDQKCVSGLGNIYVNEIAFFKRY